MTEEVLTTIQKKSAVHHGLLLGIYALLATALLIGGEMYTRDTIALRKSEDLQALLSQVIPDTLHDNNLLDNQLSIEHENTSMVVYQGVRDNKVTALAWSVSEPGYSGAITLLMGVDARGEILAVRVLSHTETPGLGDKIEEKKDDWIFSFNGRSLSNLASEKWKVKKDGGEFDQFSGATITPRAVVKAIKKGMDMFELHREKLLTINTTTPSAGL